MVCVTHEMNFAKDLADRIWFMDQGSDPGKIHTSRVLFSA